MDIYAYKNTPEVIEKSSSGGAFSKIANIFSGQYKDNYSIYGAAWTENNEIKHIRITQLADLKQFNGSKYARSNIANIFIQVENDLQNGMAVLFSGTPCQISGLIHYLAKKNVSTRKLLTIDIICHGTPNLIVLKDFISWIEKKYKSRVTNITFRDKSVGWKRYPTKIVFSNGKILRRSYTAQLYIRMYFSLLPLDNRCYSCEFSNMERASDLTLGDFWGIDKIMPEVSAEKGVSLVLVNTIKGQGIIEEIMNTLSSSEELKNYQGREFLNYQHNLNAPTERPSNYEDFWKLYKKYGFDYIVRKYGFYTKKGKMKFMIKSALIRFEFFDTRLS